MTTVDARARNLEQLAARGFVVAPSLPRERDAATALRPTGEIARRLLALDAVFTWVSATEKEASSARLRGYAERNDLGDHMTKSERAIFDLDRKLARRKHVDAIGWRLENMWSLAWILGFEPCPGLDDGMIRTAVMRAIFAFGPSLDAHVDAWLEARAIRPEAEVLALEDLFYCAHNAVRSAQLGQRAVPKGFHPVTDGGVVHERRHALTWATSPGVAWDDTDLST